MANNSTQRYLDIEKSNSFCDCQGPSILNGAKGHARYANYRSCQKSPDEQTTWRKQVSQDADGVAIPVAEVVKVAVATESNGDGEETVSNEIRGRYGSQEG